MTAERLEARRDLLLAVLDTLVPPSGDFPGAGAVALDHVLAAVAGSADLVARLARGLQIVEDAAGASTFTRLGADERERILRRVERDHPELFDALVRHTYDGYYGHPTVVGRLGLDPGPLQPRGHRIESREVPDLARVVARGPLYRRA